MRTQRAALTPRAQLSASQKVFARLITSPWYLRATTIAFYLPVAGEIDLQAAIADAQSRNCRTTLPALLGDNEQMEMRLWATGENLIKNRFGIAEPQGAAISASAHSAILLPLVAFDSAGNRLGMGKGYYDRYLANRTSSASPLRVGVAYSFQQVEQLDAEAWDVSLDAVITEQAIHLFTKRISG